MNRRIAAGLAAVILTVPLTMGAAAAPVPHQGVVCSLLPWLCPAPSDPEPTPSPTPGPTDPSDVADPVTGDPGDADAAPDGSEQPDADDSDAPDAGDDAAGRSDAEKDADPVDAPLDSRAPVFTGTPASMGSGGLSFSGLTGIGIVSVPTVDGGSIRALKISAHSITITDFSLTVRPPDGPGLVTTADEMSLSGDVTVYLGSITATVAGGEPITIGTDTPPPLSAIEPGLLNVQMGLVGTIADSISYTNTDQRIVAAG